MSKSHLDLLHHISDELDFLMTESAITNRDDFLKDEKAKRAYARSLKLSVKLLRTFPKISGTLIRKLNGNQWQE